MADLYITEDWESYGFTREEYKEFKAYRSAFLAGQYL